MIKKLYLESKKEQVRLLAPNLNRYLKIAQKVQ